VKTLVVAERKGTDLRRVTVELAAAARELGEATVVEIAGERYSPLPFVSALAKKVESEKPDLVLLGATLNGRDLGARLAARLGRAYAADVTGFRPAGNALEVDKPMYAGKVRAKLRLDLPAVVSVRPGAMPLKEGAAAPQVEKIDADTSAERLTRRRRRRRNASRCQRRGSLCRAAAGSKDPRTGTSSKSWPMRSAAPSVRPAR